MNTNGILNKLAAIITGVTQEDKYTPDKPVLPGEKVIGTLDNPIGRSLYSFTQRMKAMCEDFKAAHEGEQSQEKLMEAGLQLMEYYSLFVAVEGQYMAHVLRLFPEAAHESVEFAIRQDWKVVVWKGSARTTTAFLVRIVGADESADKKS